jgi:hypothetical protein
MTSPFHNSRERDSHRRIHRIAAAEDCYDKMSNHAITEFYLSPRDALSMALKTPHLVGEGCPIPGHGDATMHPHADTKFDQPRCLRTFACSRCSTGFDKQARTATTDGMKGYEPTCPDQRTIPMPCSADMFKHRISIYRAVPRSRHRAVPDD